MANWEDRLRDADIPAPKTRGAWEERLRDKSLAPSYNPAQGGGNLSIYNPFGENIETPIKLGESTQNFLAGTGKGMADLVKGIGQKFGAYSFDDAKETAARDAALMATGAGRGGNVTGNVAMALPLAFVPGANTLAGAALIGGGTGLAQPATGWGDMALNTGVGTVAGPLGNLAGRGIAAGAGLVRSTLEPYFDAGQRRIAADILRRFTADPQQAVRNIAADGGELIPGSLPNAAEASQSPGIAQLVKQLRQTPGSQAQADFLARDQANNAARVAAARSVSGDVGQRAFYEADRDATANQLYGAARQKGIDPANLTPEALQNIAAFQSRLPPEVIEQAKNIARMNGQPMTDATSLDGMHWVKMALDGLINKEAGQGGNSALLKAYTGLKNDLLTGMDALSPDYAAARQTFASMSRPINQMEVGEALTNRLVPAINDFGGNANLRAAAYADALRNGDATAQRVLGMPRATIADVMEPEQMSTLNALGQDLARSANARGLAAAGGSDTVQNAMSQNIINQTLGPLGAPPAWGGSAFWQSVLRPAQYAAKIGEGKVTEKLGQMLLSPQETAAALTQAEKQRITDQMARGLIKYGAPAIAPSVIAPMTYQQYIEAFDAAPDLETKRRLGEMYQAQQR